MDNATKEAFNTIESCIDEIRVAFEETEDFLANAMITCLDAEANKVNDLVVDVYKLGEDTKSIYNESLYHLLKERLELCGININDNPEKLLIEPLHEFRLHLLNIMLIKAYEKWQKEYKDMDSDAMHFFDFSKL